MGYTTRRCTVDPRSMSTRRGPFPPPKGQEYGEYHSLSLKKVDRWRFSRSVLCKEFTDKEGVFYPSLSSNYFSIDS